MGGASVVHRSTDCIALQHKENASSSDSDLLRSAPPWTKSRFQYTAGTGIVNPVPEKAVESSSSETSVSEPDPNSLAARKQKVGPVA